MDRLEEVIQELRAFVGERNWHEFHDPKNLAMAIGSEAGELLSEYRWVSNSDADAHSQKPEPRARIGAEAADIAITLLLFCDRIGLDLPEAIKDKLARNRLNYPAELSRGLSERPAQKVANGRPDSAQCGVTGTNGMICGVDGCRDGWVAAIHDLATGHTDVKVFPTVSDLIGQKVPVIVAIDIPIGLPVTGTRRCDLEARHRLGKRGSCVFPAPIRPLLSVRTQAQASELRRKLEGVGVSIQAWSIVSKVREVDDILKCTPALRGRIQEVHPEVCFYFMANSTPVAQPKKTAAGHAERVKLLEKHFGDAVSRSLHPKPSSCAPDDIIDAFAALWTAQRMVRGEAVTLPKDRLEVDALGLPMEIVA
jgi:predicted RNase H-like nuclease/NTP pyrophosphatase (non-canonical NTP hydrolase)